MTQFSYIPHTAEDRERMLQVLNMDGTDRLFEDIPDRVRMARQLDLPGAMSEIAMERHLQTLAKANWNTGDYVSFLGAGSYEHYQPSVVDAIVSRSEFYTSYTPYQPEISQGMLQAIFEYQTMVSELTGMDIANASMYDGPTAMAEAGIICCAHTRRNKLLVSHTVHPEYRAVIDTYASGQSIDVVPIPLRDGQTDFAALERMLDEQTAGLLLQYPNFLGTIEDVQTMANLAHERGALVVVNTYPIALGLLTPPGELGADVVVAEGQSLGNSMAYGGPYLGIMAVRKELMRRLPGRIVGQTQDHDGRRGFVLTLQAREQHIRREKASSNICSNQALNALTATVFLSYMGPKGMRELALQNFHKAHYLFHSLLSLPGVKAVSQGPFFNEFALQLPRPINEVQHALLGKGIFFGYDLTAEYPQLGHAVLLTVTEMRTREEIDGLVAELGGLL